MELTNKLSAIGDAIREKTGKSELLTLDAMPGEIASIETGGGGSIEVEPIVLSGNTTKYACSGLIAKAMIENFPDKITTQEITNTNNMFYQYQLTTVPFDINIDNRMDVWLTATFQGATYLKELPKIKGSGPIAAMSSMFEDCRYLRVIPDDYFNDLNYSKMINSTSAGGYNASRMFYNCWSLRSLPLQFLNNMNPIASQNYMYFYSGFRACYNLDELKGMPIPYRKTMTSSIFQNTFNNCHRLKEITFQTDENGMPLIRQWGSQTIDLTQYIGYFNSISNVTIWNSGITADKEVKDDATYQALKNNPDWFTANYNYSRYNHDSAVNTINTLPDTSAYLATAGGTNTIKFTGAAGALTDGGAINTLTAEEIAVATAKGWTVSMV